MAPYVETFPLGKDRMQRTIRVRLSADFELDRDGTRFFTNGDVQDSIESATLETAPDD